MTVVHSSVIVALFNAADPQHVSCLAWFREAIADGEPLRAPVTALGEVAEAIHTGTSDRQLARDVSAHLRHSSLFELLPVALPLAERAAAIASDHPVSNAQALYLAVADTLGDRLVTLDSELLRRGAAVVETGRP
ncbi:MAG: PIN domain-containing protein [Dehalococcoidia bacterium]|nr:PIN domain-containing protein [Dehalococcoidia bacterium]